MTVVRFFCAKCRRLLDTLDVDGLAAAKARGWHDVERCQDCYPLTGSLKATNRVAVVMTANRGWINKYGRFDWVSVIEPKLNKARRKNWKYVDFNMQDPGDTPVEIPPTWDASDLD